MESIKIVEKPEEVSWETIRSVLQEAHQAHFDAGIVMYTTTLTAEELEKRVGSNGKCYVAMDGDVVVGTLSFIHKHFQRWYCQGETAELTLQGVIPSYQGRHIGTNMIKMCEKEIRKLGINTICFDTAEQNTVRIKMALKDQYRLVDYHFNNGHFSVEMLKWLEHCPFSKTSCKLHYELKKMKVHIIHAIKPYAKRIR